MVDETNGYVQARVRLAWNALVAQTADVMGYLVERRTHYCYRDPAGVDQLTFFNKVHEWDFEQAQERHVVEEFSVSPSQLSFVDLGSPSTYERDDGTVYVTRPSGVRLSSAEAGDDAFVTIRQEYRIVTIRRDADPTYSTSVLVGYDHTATGANRITVTPQPTELSEPNCVGTAPAITLGDIVVSAIGSTTATVIVPIHNADNTLVYFGYATNTIGWQYRYVQVSSSTASVTLTGLAPGTRYYIQASLDSGFDRGRNRVTTFDTQPAS
ncbi:fibronectin type III domain-containing protein [Candidatus Poriferisodalis sp.]|uniref:fibronectin type III domain-containing protein n=1 Tax=Candidatus Poriferisodalis sp. TaxID=3101277 RepID=UPI003C702F59